jgi:DNA-binding transcriptional ArsR family regulator
LGPRRSGDPTGLAVAIALRDSGRACVCDMAWIVAPDDELVSHHGRQLKAAGLARSQRDGQMVMYMERHAALGRRGKGGHISVLGLIPFAMPR